MLVDLRNLDIQVEDSEVIRMIEADGWILVNQAGSHRQYKHPTKAGKVTVAFHGMNKDVPPFILASILRQAKIR